MAHCTPQQPWEADAEILLQRATGLPLPRIALIPKLAPFQIVTSPSAVGPHLALVKKETTAGGVIMRARFEAWAAASAMAEGGCHETALEMRQELEALRARRVETIVVAAAGDVSQTQLQHLVSMLRRFSADVLLATAETLPGKMARAMQQAIAVEHHVVHVTYDPDSETMLTSLVRSLAHVQFAICIGTSNLLCSRKSPFPVFTV